MLRAMSTRCIYTSSSLPTKTSIMQHKHTRLCFGTQTKGSLRPMKACSMRVHASAAEANTARIIVQGLHMPVTPSLKEYAESKVNKVINNFEGIVKEVDVKLSASGNHGSSGEAHHNRNQRVEMTIYTLGHGVIRVEDTEDDMYAAVDLVTDKLKRKMMKMKERSIQKNMWPGRGGTKGGVGIVDVLPEYESSEDEEDVISSPSITDILREKVLILESPISPEEAIYRMEAVGHDFYVFEDASDNCMKILYRRRSQGYGLLIPQSGK